MEFTYTKAPSDGGTFQRYPYSDDSMTGMYWQDYALLLPTITFVGSGTITR